MMACATTTERLLETRTFDTRNVVGEESPVGINAQGVGHMVSSISITRALMTE
jgi:hypothetical protein